MRSQGLVLGALLSLFACGGEEGGAGEEGTGASSAVGGAGGSGGVVGAGGAGAGGGLAGGGGVPVPQNQFLYVAHRGSDDVRVYTIGDDGALASVGSVDVIDAGPLAVDPSREHLYVASVQPDSLRVFSIDHATGDLSPLGGPVDVGIRPVYLAVDPTDGWLFVASYGDDQVQTHAISADGSFAATPTSSQSPGTNPHSVLVHPSGQWAFVPVTNSAPSLVAQYGFDAMTGLLTPNGAVDAGMGVGPRHAVFHPTLDRLYVVNEHDDSVTTYALDTSHGSLSALETVSTLPDGVDGGQNTCADIHVTPDGTALYASNRGHDSLAMFSLDATTGLPTSLGQAPTEAIPREFEVTVDGRYVYAAGQDSDKLAAYRVEPDGSLAALEVYDVGQTPSWVLAISVDAP